MLQGGYAGRFLWVDLTHEKTWEEPLEEGFARKYLGGAGFCSRVLYDMLEPGVEPLSAENVLMFATGPLTGTMFPQGARYTVAAKSPLTDIWGESHAAGHWAPELKFAGYDAIVILGRSPKPVYLWVRDGTAELRDATGLWGRTTYDAYDVVREEVGDPETKVACIGPAGENLVRYASVINECSRIAARSGMGAVMGFKRLKAIVVRGTGGLDVAEPDGYLDLIREFYRKMLANPFTDERVKYGTTSLIELMQSIGRLPTYNLRQGVYDDYEEISGETLRKKYFLRPRADFACLQRCGRFVEVPGGPYKCIGKGPEFECLSSLGSRSGNPNLESIIYAHSLCNQYGMDTVSTGATISWAMECYDEGLITKEDTDGLDLTWGNHEAIVRLVEMIAQRKGFGDLLAEGSWRAAKHIGKGSERFFMGSKKQEIAGQEPRAQKSMGLASATSARGADHLYAFPVLDEVGFEDDIKERLGEEYLPEMRDRLDPTYKGIMVRENEDFAVVVESVGVCKYGTMIPPVHYYEDICRALVLTTGFDFTESELRTIGERIVNLNRAFNAREGVTRKDDTLPRRLTKVPSPVGPAKGQVVELEQMLDEYYQTRGWDVASGLPTKTKLAELDLADVYGDLVKLGKIA
ncbi:MAG: aldehyde ferredoxin oxidoreductase family protein [Candidatus Geothermarchaeales archaeon]